MALFTPRSTKEFDKTIINKANTTRQVFIKGSGAKGRLSDLIASAEVEINRYFSKFKDDFIIIRDEETLKNYINKAIVMWGYVM